MDVTLPRRPLGRTGLSIGVLGLGTVKLGRNTGVKYPAAFEVPDDRAARTLLDTAAELGINLLDTAPAYGASEERLGRLLADGAGGGRDALVLCTKAGESFDPATGESSFDFSPAAITASVERSLRRLRTDRLDAVLLHSDGRDEWVVRESGAVEALERLRERGLCRVIGVSTKTPAGAMAAIERLAPPNQSTGAAVMVTYNPRDTVDGPAIDAAHAAGVGVLVKKALLSGHLFAPSAGGAGDEPTTADPAVACLRFVLAHHGVSCAVVGTINPEHLRRNAAAAAAAVAGAS